MKTDNRIYLDVCTYCRPYDDQSVLRNRLEADAYYLILSYIQSGQYVAIVSPVHEAEVLAISDKAERDQVLSCLNLKGARKASGYDVLQLRERAEELVKMNFGVADAAHIAFAELTAAVFISCDDGLVKRCRKKGIPVPVFDPVEFVEKEGLR